MSIRDLTPWTWDRKSSARNVDYHSIHALDRLFDDLFSSLDINPFGQSGATEGWMAPRIDVFETDKDYSFFTQLPGVDEQDVEVTLLNGVLTIRSQKMSATEQEGDHFLRAERHCGTFERSFSLPSDIDEEKVEASFKKGDLTVTVAKGATAKSTRQRIEISKAA